MNVKVELTCYLKMSNGTVVPKGTIFEGETADDLPSDIKKEFVTRSSVLIIHSDGKKEVARKMEVKSKEEHTTIQTTREAPQKTIPEKEGTITVSNDSENSGNLTSGDSGESTQSENVTSDTEKDVKVEGAAKTNAPVLKKIDKNKKK